MKSPYLACIAVLCWTTSAAAQGCGGSGIFVQALGSGGPQLQEGRASSAFVVWIDGKARVLVDAGGGTALRFGQSGARIADLDAILLTDLQADHSAGLPALVNASQFAHRRAPLPLFGPGASPVAPSTITFVRDLFDSTRGAYRNLGDFLSPLGQSTYKLKPHEIPAKWNNSRPVYAIPGFRVFATPVTHAPVPMLVWRIDIGRIRIVFAADAMQPTAALEKFVAHADLLIAPGTVGDGGADVMRDTRRAQSAIGRIAGAARVRELVLARRASRASAGEEHVLTTIRHNFRGPIHLVNDLQCLTP
ncbi:MAG: MBL fold metallo-hydrolase [Acidiferrobacterales bacterium]